MTRRWGAMVNSHTWKWWTPIASVAGVAAVIVALLTWQYPKSSGNTTPQANTSATPLNTSLTSTPTSALTANPSISEYFSIDLHAKLSSGWKKEVDQVMPLAVVQFMATYKNVSAHAQDFVWIRVKLPPELTYMKDSTRLLNSTNPNGLLVQHDNITDVGVHIGGYQPQAVGYLAFSTMVATGDQFDCTPRTLVPLATVLTQEHSLSNEVKVRVHKRCP